MNVPPTGYILPKWGFTHAYRATALAYMKRENVTEVENKDGKTYTLEQLEKAIIGYQTSN